jgi:uncharacterized protein
MILYLDTSALLKRYFQESYSEEVAEMWNKAEIIATSSVAYAETMATLYRKKKEAGLSQKVTQNLTHGFQQDWGGFVRVEVTDDLNEYIDTVVKNHYLRGFDAIHLASAVVIHERLPHNFFFACFDQKLNQAARREGLQTF